MTYGYSEDFRLKVLDYISSGHSKASASRIFKISRQTIYSWIGIKATTGGISIQRKSKKASKIQAESLKAYISKYPDAYLYEIGKEFDASASGILRALKRLKISRKKNYAVSGEERIKKTNI